MPERRFRGACPSGDRLTEVLARPVRTPRAGAHRLAEVLSDDRVRLADPGECPADCLAHRDASAFRVMGKRPGAPGKPDGPGQMLGEPLALGQGARGPVVSTSRVELFDFGVESYDAP